MPIKVDPPKTNAYSQPELDAVEARIDKALGGGGVADFYEQDGSSPSRSAPQSGELPPRVQAAHGAVTDAVHAATDTIRKTGQSLLNAYMPLMDARRAVAILRDPTSASKTSFASAPSRSGPSAPVVGYEVAEEAAALRSLLRAANELNDGGFGDLLDSADIEKRLQSVAESESKLIARVDGVRRQEEPVSSLIPEHPVFESYPELAGKNLIELVQGAIEIVSTLR